MKKKMISLVLAATMLLGASMTVLADDPVTATGGADVTIESTINSPQISVTITKGDNVVANPYALEISGITLADGETYPTLGGSTITFVNGGNTAISIGLTGKIELASYGTDVVAADKVTVASSLSSLSSAKTKQVYVQAEITSDAEGTKQFYKSGSTTAEKALVYTTSGAKLSNAPVLAASGKEDTTAGTSSTMVVNISGGTSLSPTSAWSDADKFSVVTTYDIQLSSAASLSTFKAAATS